MGRPPLFFVFCLSFVCCFLAARLFSLFSVYHDNHLFAVLPVFLLPACFPTHPGRRMDGPARVY